MTRQLWKKAGAFLLDFTEIYVPALAFSAMFVVFMIQVFFRYFIVPLTWPLEFTLMAFIWTTLFGACYAHRDKSHVVFSLVYDRVGPKTQRLMRITGNFLLASAFALSLWPSYKYVQFMSFKVSDVLKVPMNLAFSPYLFFLVIMIGRLIYDLVVDIRALLSKESGKGGGE
jgi:TRAP-type C4-dicarboxylate transport system permease small subunit